MKKKLLLLLALVVVGVGVNSCSQDADYPENDPSGDSGNWRESVTRAKAYFEAVYSPDLKTRTAQHSPAVAALSSMEVNPDWEHSLYSEDDDASYWEFPLLSEKRYGTGSPDEVRTADRRLVVREDRQTGELSLYTSLWMPADDPSENQMSGLTLVDISDFSGNVFLFYPDGQFYYGTHFVEGQRRGTVNLREVTTASPGLTRSGGGCETYFEGYLEQYCWYSSNHEMIYCTPWDLVIQYEYDVCDEDIDDTGEDDGGGGSGGNGGNPGGVGGPGGTQKLVTVPNNYCVLGTVAAALQLKFGLTEAEALSRATAALKAVGIDFATVPSTGPGGVEVGQEQIIQVLTSLGFSVDLSPTGGLGTHFNKGGYGIGHFIPQGGNPAHDVLVVSYNDGTMSGIYYDSVKGEYLTGRPNSILPFK